MLLPPQVLQMTPSAIAVLSSASGDMQFFTIEAVKVWAEMEASLRPILPATPSPLLGPVGSDELTVEGHPIKHWVQHAKKKSAIASAICKQNGELKARLAKLDCCATDPFSHFDP